MPAFDQLRDRSASSTIRRVKAFNLVSAVVTATVLATAAVQRSAPDGGASGWRFVATWGLGALVWAVAFSFVRDGVGATLRGLARRG